MKTLFNVGIIGSVSAGKSSLVKSCTGIITQRHSQEKIRNITINIGYGNYKHISFIDCPGHADYINKTVEASSLMDGAILVIAADVPIVKETVMVHLQSIKQHNIHDKLIVCINKIDLVNKELVKRRKYELDNLLASLEITPYVIIPVCFNKNINVEILADQLTKMLPEDSFIDKSNEKLEFLIIRSFDVNKPGTPINDIKGGIVGGTIKRGKISVGDKIIIDNKFKGSVIEIRYETTIINSSINGGLIAIQTDIDPYFMKSNNLAYTQLLHFN